MLDGMIPSDLIEEVRLRSDIVELISRYIKLKKTGKNFTGSCPFHSERTPSFTVTPDKQIFHCFGCKAGGDVFRFLMLKENLTFNEALAMLAEQAGIDLPSEESPALREKERKEVILRQINSLAMEFYRKILQHHPDAAPARRYLAGRGLTQEVLERFQVGFALPGWDMLLGHLAKMNCQPKEAVQAGLAIQSEAGRIYDRFRNRIIFPIWDAAGRVRGFGGRVLDDSLPKYLNTPETASFSKSRLLYGLHLARAAIKEKGYVVVAEGYMDVITAHMHGAANVVASLGTALTAEQGKLLMRYSRNTVIAFDADSAGVAAALRGLEIMNKLGCQVRVVTIPDGKDPDDYIRKNGSQPWEDLINQAPSLIEFKLLQAVKDRPVNTVGEKLEVMHQVLPDLESKSEVEIEEGLKTIARSLNLSWEAVAGEFKRIGVNWGKKRIIPDNIVKTKHTILGKGERQDARAKAEAVLLRLVLEEPSLGLSLAEELGETPFNNRHYQRIYLNCMELSLRQVFRATDLFSCLPEEDHNVLSQILTQEIPGGDLVQIMSMYLESIARCNRRERREMLLKEIGMAERAGKTWLCNDLLRELSILKGIDQAEKAGDRKLMATLIQEHQQFKKPNN